MEGSPLVLAHRHARSALLETRRSNPVAASEEHDLASAEFGTAAHGTANLEAQRILLLLEEHHKKLGQILKFRHENPAQDDKSQSHASTSTAQSASIDSSSHPTIGRRTSSPDPSPPLPRLSQTPRSTRRDASNSIASNLASARGIPGSQPRRSSPASPTLSAQHAGGKMVPQALKQATVDVQSRDSDPVPRSHLRDDATEPSKATSTAISSRTKNEQDNTLSGTTQPKAASDAPFQQFYSTFESLISKLSAPLAFAGLPLTSSSPALPEEAKAKHVSKPTSKRSKQADPDSPQPADVDYSTLISRAALRAVRDGASVPTVAESFYVVPTTGGTVSYAGILNREQKEANRHQRHLSNISEDADDFVDARENVTGSASPELTRLDSSGSNTTQGWRQSRQSTSGSTNTKRTSRSSNIDQLPTSASGKTMEELALENQALKHLSDTLSKRLHMWEVNAQSSSAALQQSLRSLQNRATSPSSITRSDSGKGGQKPVSEEDKQQIEELEETIKRIEKEKARQERENEKLKNVVGRYRERWEKLKEGAKSRREGIGIADGNRETSEVAADAPAYEAAEE